MRTEDGRNRNIIVCVKLVPDFGKNDREPCGPAMKSQAVQLNPFDGYALEAAARLRDADEGVRIIALSVGRSGEDEALRRALSIAADHALLAAVPNPDALDALSVSRVLAAAIRRLEETFGTADLIFCGRQSTDGQSAQVGPQLAQCLHCAFIGRGLEAALNKNTLRVKQEARGGTLIAAAELPCVAAFTNPGWSPRLPTIKSSVLASAAVIPTLEFPQPPPPALMVRAMRAVPKRSGGITIRERDAENSARRLFRLLSSSGVL